MSKHSGVVNVLMKSREQCLLHSLSPVCLSSASGAGSLSAASARHQMTESHETGHTWWVEPPQDLNMLINLNTPLSPPAPPSL